VKFLFDHDVPDDMAYGLSALGHEVFKLRELIDPQTSDEKFCVWLRKTTTY
jgi:hypothetical protein